MCSSDLSNTMCFPAGILQAPQFDVNASLEENLGGIGTTIAHEITHAFDKTGAKFDAKGLQKDWWEPKDYERFEALCKKAAEFYDGWESSHELSHKMANRTPACRSERDKDESSQTEGDQISGI